MRGKKEGKEVGKKVEGGGGEGSGGSAQNGTNEKGKPGGLKERRGRV